MSVFKRFYRLGGPLAHLSQNAVLLEREAGIQGVRRCTACETGCETGLGRLQGFMLGPTPRIAALIEDPVNEGSWA